MKELSIEEKAKHYDEAIERAKAYQGLRSEMEIIFPELRESEDERVLKIIKETLKSYNSGVIFGSLSARDYADCLAWLEKKPSLLTKEKALKNSPFVEQKPVWSEKDELMLISTTQSLKLTNGAAQMKIDWLNSLKERVQPQNIVYYNPYKEVVESIAEMCKHYDKASHSGLRDFYDDVKVKCKDAKEYESLYPQSTWKPSDEQMHYLSWIANVNLGDSLVEQEVSKHLNELLEDLKKLREE